MSHLPPDSTATLAPPEGYDLFLSYNSEDGEAVGRVRPLVSGRGVKTFQDRFDLTPGKPWRVELEGALRRSRAVAVFLGRAGLGREQLSEFSYALDRQRDADEAGERFLVIPVLLPGADIQQAPMLRQFTWIDLRQGLDDRAELDRLAQAVLGTAPAGEAPRPADALPPYRDLRAFREEDAPLFFGRETVARELLEKTRAHGLVAVIGPSGSGKSSVVQAGLLPLLRREPPPHPVWDALTFMPGENPFHNLARRFVSLWEPGAGRTALVIKAGQLGDSWAAGAPLELAVSETLAPPYPADRLLVVADQFEELFTQTPERLRRPFADALVALTKLGRVTVMLTLRADFYGQAVGLSPELSDLVHAGLVYLKPMRREELRAAVEEPARHVGLGFEPGLVGRILDHVEEQPGNLPLLEFALTELWRKRQGATLRNQDYEEIGGVEGAISKRAEEQFQLLPPAGQGELLRFMTRLVRVSAADEEGTDTRRRVGLRGLDARARESIEAFVRARLLVKGRGEAADEETAEVAHEALIRKWPRLRELLDGDREFLLWRQRLGLRLDEYERTGHDRGTLLGGALLAEARKFYRERREDLDDAERDYILASEPPKRRALYTAAAVFLFLLTVAGLLAWRSDANQLRLIRNETPALLPNARPDTLNEWLAALTFSGRLDEALAAARTAPPPHSQALALAAIAAELLDLGRPDEASTVAAEAAALAEAHGEDGEDLRTLAHLHLAETFFRLGMQDEAGQQADEATDAPSPSKYPHRRRLVEILIRTGRPDKASDALPFYDKENWDLYAYACDLLISQNKIKEAVRLAVESSSSAVRIHVARTLLASNNGEEALEMTRTPGGDDKLYYERPLDKMEGQKIAFKVARATRGEAEARTLAARSFDLAGETPQPLRAHAYAKATEILLEAGDQEQARQAASRALDAARQLRPGIDERAARVEYGYQATRGAAYAASVKAFGLLGDFDRARAAATESTVIVRDVLYDAGNAHVALAVALDRAGRGDEARQVAAESYGFLNYKVDDDIQPEDAVSFLLILMDAGYMSEALELLDSSYRSEDTRLAVEVALARREAVYEVTDRTLNGLVIRKLVESGSVSEALSVATLAEKHRAELYRWIADDSVKRGRAEEFRAAAVALHRERIDRMLMQVSLAESLVAAGDRGGALEAVGDALAQARQLRHDQSALKLGVLARAAKIQALLGLFREARETAQSCTPDARLGAAAAALLGRVGAGGGRAKRLLDPAPADAAAGDKSDNF